MKVLNVYYIVKPGKRDDFYNAVVKSGVPEKSRAEKGNIKYDYYFPVDNENEVLLIEHWKDEAAFKFHTEQEHFKGLQSIKAEYVEDVRMDKFEI